MITGCSKSKNITTFMIQKQENKYTLYNQEGKRLTEATYKTYEENSQRGYLVTNDKDQYAYLNYNGKEIVPAGEYDQLIPADYMIIGQKNVENDKKQKIMTAVCVINSEGETIFKADENSILKASGLPIVCNENIWKVLYKDGEDLYKGSEEVFYADHDPLYQVYVIALKDKLYIYHEVEEEMQTLEIEATGEYVLKDTDDKGCLLYDEKQKSVIAVDLTTMTSHEFKNITAAELYYDESSNIVVKNGDSISLLSRGVKEPVILNGYYKDAQNYVYRGKEVYGPHILYKDGKIQGSIKDCQIYPAAVKIEGDYFPVYIKNKGYQYYDLQGKQPFTTSFYEAEPFDKNALAIVKDKANSTFLINDSGQQVTSKKYFDIKYIGSSYYAVYNEDGKFGIVDTKGKEILPLEYTSLSDQNVFVYNDNEYIMIEKNGRTYVYDCHDYDEVFSQEGQTIFNEKGYFVVNDIDYYTFDGELIH